MQSKVLTADFLVVGKLVLSQLLTLCTAVCSLGPKLCEHDFRYNEVDLGESFVEGWTY